MSDRATLRRLLREHAEAVSTEIAFIKEDAILRLFDATQSEHDAQVAALTAALQAEIERLREALEKIRGVAGNRANPEADKAVIIGIVNDALKGGEE